MYLVKSRCSAPLNPYLISFQKLKVGAILRNFVYIYVVKIMLQLRKDDYANMFRDIFNGTFKFQSQFTDLTSETSLEMHYITRTGSLEIDVVDAQVAMDLSVSEN